MCPRIKHNLRSRNKPTMQAIRTRRTNRTRLKHKAKMLKLTTLTKRKIRRRKTKIDENF